MGAIFMLTRIVNRSWIGGVKVTLNLNLPCYGEVKQLRLKTSVPTYEKMKILNVAEKNDAAKSIANVMSRGASQRVSIGSHSNNIDLNVEALNIHLCLSLNIHHSTRHS